MNLRLRGEVTGDSFDHHYSVFSSSNAVEQLTNIIITHFKGENIEDKILEKTLGQKLGVLRDIVSQNPKYFIDIKMLEYITELITKIRNNVVHPSSEKERDEIVAIQSHIFANLSITFMQFMIKTLSAFMNQNGELVNVKILETPKDEETLYFFGLDGDSTGDYLEIAFGDLPEDEDEVLKRSETIRKAIFTLKKIIWTETRDHNSILFAEGDNVLFKARYSQSLITQLQRNYKEITGLSSSIGFGKTLREATIAMRLAKAQKGDSVLGICLQNS